MSESTDQHLLSAWAKRRDEAAFRSLFGRYAGFVHGAALRRVRDAGLAEEITQDVFARLSQNAGRLTEHPALAGWLHRAAMLLALERLRHRRREVRRVDEYSTMNAPATRDPMADVLPVLDDALDSLAAADREVLLLHFVERLSYAQIATRVDSTADAVRMRSSRALAALTGLLRKRGVTISAALLASGLGSTLAKAAPSTLTLVPASLAGAGKVSAETVIIHAFQTTNAAKMAAVIVAGLGLVAPLIWQQREIAAAEVRIAQMEQRASGNGASDRAAGATPSQLARLRQTGGLDLGKLVNAVLDEGAGTVQVQRAAAQLDDNNLVGLIETVLKTGLLPEPRDKLVSELLVELEKRNLGLHVHWSLKAFAATIPNASIASNYGGQWQDAIRGSFEKWALKEPEKAARWEEANEEEWRRLNGYTLKPTAVAAQLLADRKTGYAKLETLSNEDATSAIRLASRNGKLGEADFREMVGWAASLGDVEKRRALITATMESRSESVFRSNVFSGQILENSAPLLRELSLDLDDFCAVATNLARASAPGFLSANTSGLARTAFPWLEKTLPPNRVAYAKGATLSGSGSERTEFAILSEEFARQPDDELIAGYVESPFASGSTGFRLALQAGDPERRLTLLATAWKSAQRQSEETARALLDSPELSESDRAAIRVRAANVSAKMP